ncbi:MAG: manno-octulosonate cytidylyltransferase [Pseudomonadota bacterium]
MKTAIIIPSRYGSTRLEGKPLIKIAGVTMLERVVLIAKKAAQIANEISVIVATDDERIAIHCREIDVDFIMTPPECPSGTDRVANAVNQLKYKPDFILNMQGDAPLTPPDFLEEMIKSFNASACDVVTPVVQLKWSELDKLRENKKTTPLSGTSAVFNEKTGNAFWFSKNIIPSIRNEEKLRQDSDLSPVFRHIGLYGYSMEMLNIYNKLPESKFEKLEGLEQLRIIENGYNIRCVKVDYKGRHNMSGVDSKEDVARAEELLK